MWESYHGEESLDAEWHEGRNICLKRSQKVLDEAKTFGDLGFKKTSVRYQITFVLGLGGGSTQD